MSSRNSHSAVDAFAAGDRFEIPGFRVDRRASELVAEDGRRLRLETRAMEVLVELCRRPGEVVSTDELFDRVWRGSAVSSHSVAIVVSDLRKALGDDARAPRFIETVPKRGYRFVAAVSPATDDALSSRRRRWGLVAGAAALAVGLAAVAWPGLVRGTRGGRDEPAVDRATAEKYFQARQLWSRREPEGALAARRLLEEILATNDDFAPAHAALADLYVHKTGEYLGVAPLEAFRAGQRHLDRALELAPEEPDLYVTRSLLAFYRDRQPRKALAALDRALALDPELAHAWQSRGMVLSAIGEHDASLAAIRRARELDPLSPAIGWDEVWFLYLAGRPDEGLAALERESRVSPRNRFYEALLEQSAGRSARAVDCWLARYAERGVALAAPERVRALAGDGAAAYGELLTQLGAADGYEESPGVVLVLQVLAGDLEAAQGQLAALRSDRHETWILNWMAEMPLFTEFAARAEVRALLAREGLLAAQDAG